jgi:hypothetical protein
VLLWNSQTLNLILQPTTQGDFIIKATSNNLRYRCLFLQMLSDITSPISCYLISLPLPSSSSASFDLFRLYSNPETMDPFRDPSDYVGQERRGQSCVSARFCLVSFWMGESPKATVADGTFHIFLWGLKWSSAQLSLSDILLP